MSKKATFPPARWDPVPPPPPNEVFRVRVHGDIEGQATVNTFTWRMASMGVGLATRADIDALATLIQQPGEFLDVMAAAISIDWGLTGFTIDLPTHTTLSPVEYDIPARSGGGPTGHCPTTVSAVLHKRSTFAGRHGRGRVGLPGVPLDWVTGTHIQAGFVSAYQTLANTFALPMVSGSRTWFPGVLGTDKSVHPTDPVLWTLCWVDTGEGTVNTILGNIRRRRPGRGI
jgi:hypothetical protein